MVCRHDVRDVKPSVLGRVLGRLRLFRGSGDDHAVCASTAAQTSADYGQVEFTRNHALEVELAEAWAVAQWQNSRRWMM